MSGASGLRKHGHTSSGDGGALGAASPSSLVIPSTASPAQTAEGSAVWDSDDDKLTVGTGSGRKTLVNEGGSLSLLTAPTADFSIGSHKLTSVTDPSSAQDAATKKYVDDTVGAAGGLSDHGVFTYLDATVASAPSSPSAGYLRVYAKTGGHLAQKDSGGTETLLDAAGGGSRNGAKVYLTAANLSQLSNGGYVWDATEYDDASYVTTYTLAGGTNSQLDNSAVVFAIPADGTYRITGLLRPYWSGTPDPAFEGGIRLVTDRFASAGARVDDQGHFGMNYDRDSGSNPTYTGSTFVWEGALVAASDKAIGIWTGFSVSTDAIQRGSWMSILRIA